MQQPLPAADWRATPIARILGPMQEFIHASTSGGLVLLGAAALALLLANSPLAPTYDGVLHASIGVTVGPFELKHSLLHWINDGLMAIFFFLVGLEIKREVLVGELADPRAALLPIVAAAGGVVVPAAIYTAITWGGPGAAGWAIPMATDIAFALGVLALLGDRIPFALKVFLTAVAIVDDLLAVLVIALFYSGGLNLVALAAGLGLLVLLGLLNVFGIRTLLGYTTIGVLVWLAFLESGVHATIAGVLVALTVPARTRIDAPTFAARARELLARFEARADDGSARMLTDEEQQSTVLALEDACEAVQAPLQKAEHTLHAWVAFLVMPVFALANAGVALSLARVAGETAPIALGIVAGLIIGKPVGLLGGAWLAVRTGLADLPVGVGWPHLVGAGCLAGIGFTMSLFIAALAFPEGNDPFEQAKIGIFAGSLVAAAVGFLVLRNSKE